MTELPSLLEKECGLKVYRVNIQKYLIIINYNYEIVEDQSSQVCGFLEFKTFIYIYAN